MWLNSVFEIKVAFIVYNVTIFTLSCELFNYSVNFLLETTMEVMENMVGFHQNHASEVSSYFVSSMRFWTALKQTQIL